MYSWKRFAIRRFFGLDEKTNIVDVKDGNSPEAINIYQDATGIVSKCKGNEILFASDFDASTEIDEIGSGIIGGTKYWFEFAGGDFHYATSASGTKTTISPSPAISTSNPIWWEIIDEKLFFVDGTNQLRFFDGTAIYNSFIADRPTTSISTATVGTGYDYGFTIERTLSSPTAIYAGESPINSSILTNKNSTISAILANPIGPSGYNYVEGDIIRIYRKSTGTAIGWQLVATHTVTGAEAGAGTFTQSTSAPTDDSPQLYTDLGLAINKSAPTGLTGITSHYGRLVGWKDSTVYVSKSSNVHSFPDQQAVKEAFVYTFNAGDGEDITTCVSYRESLFVLKPSTGAIFVGVGPDDSGGNAFAFRRYEAKGNGCIAGKSAKVVGEEKNTVLIYLSNNGFYATDGNDPIRIGEKVEPTVRSMSTAVKSTAVAVHERRIGHYMCFLGPQNARICLAFDVRKDENGYVGWFKYDAFPVKCVAWDSEEKYLAGTFEGYAFQSRNSDLPDDFSIVSAEYVSSSDVDTGADSITVANSYTTGDPIIFRTSGTVPTGLANNTTYYVIVLSATEIQLATSEANALAGTEINITSQGSGTHSLIAKAAIDGYYTTNWLNFQSPGQVKKLAKPSLIFNAKASQVDIELSIAYDWFPAFTDTLRVQIQSSHIWGYPLSSPEPWGTFIWGSGALASPRNIPIPRRKVRSIRYKFRNANIDEDMNLQGFEQDYAYIRNRGNWA